MRLNLFCFGLLCLCLVVASQEVTQEQKCQMGHANLQREALKFKQAVDTLDSSSVYSTLLSIQTILPIFNKVCPFDESNIPKSSMDSASCIESIQTTYSLILQVINGDFKASQLTSNELLSIIPATISKCDSTKIEKFSFVKQMLESSNNKSNSSNSKGCMMCGFMVTLAMNNAAYRQLDMAQYLKSDFCKTFPDIFLGPCQSFIDSVGPTVISAYAANQTSDYVCRETNRCAGEYAECGLHNEFDSSAQFLEASNIFQKNKSSIKDAPWQWIMDLVNKFADDHLPIVDLDSDGFSTISRERGYSWRGKDCNDFASDIYPGRKAFTNLHRAVDYDCNGISGINKATGHTFKDELCSGSDRLGVIVIGDSAGAHFSLPPKYFNVSMWEEGTFDDFVPNALNEFDLPEMSANTGHVENPLVHSIYQRVVERNRCNRNDYQNIGVNGARSGDMRDFEAIRRNSTLDHPQLVVYELIGNDVCHGDHSINAMTKPDEFKKNTLEAWNFLDTVLPKGSHMVVWGLAKGTLLYDLLHDKEHPLFVKYSAFYEFLNCLETSPCWGWMNNDADTREMTQQRAEQLNQVYRDLIATTTFNNFDIIYYDFPIEQAIVLAERDGYQAYELFEAADGFHPNQVANYYVSEVIWENLLVDRPHWIPAENPHNQKIDELFGAPAIRLEQA